MLGSGKELASEHAPFVVLLLVAALVRALAAAAYWPVLFYSDSWAYLDLSRLTQFGSDRPSGYPILLWLLALPGRSLGVISLTQHCAGLVTGVLVYVLLLRLGTPRWAALVASGAVLLDAYAIVLEQTVLAETFTCLAVVLSVFLVVGEHRPALRVTIGGLLLAGAVSGRLAVLYAVPVWLLYVLWRHRGLRNGALGAAAVCLPLLAYSAVYDVKTGHFGLTRAGGWFAYGRVAEIADCGKFTPPAGTRDLCEPGGPRPGRHAGYYIWSGHSPANRKYGGPGDPGSNEPLRRFASAVIRQRPLAYAGLVANDTLRYFEPGVVSPGKSDTAISFPAHPRTGSPWVNERVRASMVPNYSPPAGAPGAVLRAYRSVVHPPRPILALLLLVALAVLVLALLGRRPAGTSRRPEIFLLSGMGLAMVVGPAASSGFILRYLVPAVPLIVCGGTLALVDLTRLARRDRPSAGV